MSDTPDTDDSDSAQSRRRRILTWAAGLSIVSFFVGILTPLKDLAIAVARQAEAEDGEDGEGEHGGLPGQTLVFAQDVDGNEAGDPVTTDALEAPRAVQTFPENSEAEHHLILLHKLEEGDLSEPTNLDWADQGFVAYSAICTHLGCSVNWFEEEDDVGFSHDHCPCHVAKFDPYRGAEVLTGPAPRPLPQIGVSVNDDDEVELTSDFEAQVGGE